MTISSYNNFQDNNQKYSKNRSNIYNPAFDSPIEVDNGDFISQHLHKWMEFVSFLKFYPDYFYDLIKPKTGQQFNFDLDQRVMLRALVRFPYNYDCIPRGGSKCVTGDTIIFTNEGLLEIGELFNYSKPSLQYETSHLKYLVNRYGDLELSTAGIVNGKQKIKKIETNEGYFIKSTFEHPILVMNNHGDLTWKKSKDIVIGDYIPISRNINVWGNSKKLNINMEKYLSTKTNQSKHQILRAQCNIPNELDSELGLIIGYLLGDGCLTRDNLILFTNKDIDIVNNFKNYFTNRLNIDVKQKNEINYIVSGMYVREIFRQIGLEQCDAFNKEIPKLIMKSTKDIVVSVIKGLFDTDGCVTNKSVQLCTASEKMANQVHNILLNLGIVSLKRRYFNKKFKTYHYKIIISGNNIDLYKELIGFSCKRKESILNKACNKKRNTNKDIIPYQAKRIRDIYPFGETRDKFYHVLAGNNQFTYQKSSLLSNDQSNFKNKNYNFEYLQELIELNYFYSPVTSIVDDFDYVYDVHMPKTNSFISNGIISHNTLLHIMADYHTCLFYPNISMSVLASTKQSAVEIWEDKHNEIITFFPYINDCIRNSSFTKDKAKVEFVNGSWIDNLANSQQSKGKRRRRGGLEEDNLVDKETFEDAIAPIFNVPRKTIAGIEDPEELNGQLNRFTTSGYKNSDSYETIMQHYRDMVDLKGSFVYTSDWCIPVHFGRQKMSVINKARTGRITAFKMNYLCDWIGNGEGSLINVSLLMKSRIIKYPEFECEKDKRGKLALVEYVIAVDVARSASSSNNKSAIVVLKIIRGSNGKVRQVHLVNIVTPPNGLNYAQQATIVKKVFYQFGGHQDISKSRVKAIVVDANIIGQGLVEELLKDTTDTETGKELGCFNTINTDEKSQNLNAPNIVYSLKSQGINGKIITNFIDYVESNRLKLVSDFKEIQDVIKQSQSEIYEQQSMQMQFLIDEVANLKIKSIKNDSDITVEQNTKRIDKDRYAATAYGLFYIEQFLNEDQEEDDDDDPLVFF